MSDNNVRWEPIRGNERLAAVGRIADMLPTGYALCRAVPAPTWSQEPPTEEGWYWFVGELIWPLEDDPGQEVLTKPTPLKVELHQRYEMIVEFGGEPWIVNHARGYWLPATVPQPPGEVGEVGE